jgi:catechol 2,3-dioxygenase-like lactoylglutathione lyase family enzyme
VHVGVDPEFHPQTKAHPAFLVADLEALSARLAGAGYSVTTDTAIPGTVRIFSHDPFGNRIEFIQDGTEYVAPPT